MLIRDVQAAPFVTYPKLARKFPQQGVMLLTGKNGAGKSSLYEVISWVLYGDTLRGAKVAEAAGTLLLGERGEEYKVERTRGKRNTKLTFNCGMLDMTGATPTATQLKIDEVFGSFEQFKHGHVFARDLLAKFGLATDGERKGLIEELLGLQQFDKAQVLAATDRAQADVKLRVADGALPHVNAAAEAAVKALAELEGRSVRDPGVIELEIRTLEQADAADRPRRDALSRQVADLSSALREALRTDAAALADMRMAEREVADLRKQIERHQTGQDACSACKRPYDATARAEAIEELQDRMERAAMRTTRARPKAPLIEEEHAEVREQLSSYEASMATRAKGLYALRAELMVAKDFEQQKAKAAVRVSDAKAAALQAAVERDEAAKAKALADCAVGVLGLKGARCLLLGRALKRLEQEANLFLAQVHPQLRVKVADDIDKIALKVVGAGGGEYKGCSGAQRALVDIALMMGLAALRGGDGLLVFDEVFDSMDAERVERVAEYLQGIARTRQVLVISHREDFAALFRRSARWRAVMDEDGLSALEDA